MRKLLCKLGLHKYMPWLIQGLYYGLLVNIKRCRYCDHISALYIPEADREEYLSKIRIQEE